MNDARSAGVTLLPAAGFAGGPGPLREKRERLAAILAGLGHTLVAYSGGVDSTLLLWEAWRALGDGACGVIADSPSLPRAELESALALAARAGIPVRVVRTREVERDAYRANGPDRCYHCKAELFETLGNLAAEEGWETLAYGAVTDDLGDVRPGMTAARERLVRAPLLEAGLAKVEVRALARGLGLPVWDKPQAACLASRIRQGMEVTPERLAQVERAETLLREALAVRILRVRHEGARARIEVALEDIGRVSEAAKMSRISLLLGDLGFSEVVVDPRGYRRADPLPDSDQEAI